MKWPLALATVATTLAFALAGAGCGSSDSWRASVQRRAAFDLSCPEPQVQVVTLSENWNAGGSYGATGCGRQASYIYRSGQAILNSAVVASPAAPAP